jgi:hypothetical protein
MADAVAMYVAAAVALASNSCVAPYSHNFCFVLDSLFPTHIIFILHDVSSLGWVAVAMADAVAMYVVAAVAWVVAVAWGGGSCCGIYGCGGGGGDGCGVSGSGKVSCLWRWVMGMYGEFGPQGGGKGGCEGEGGCGVGSCCGCRCSNVS